ncbi:ABC transporter permease [Butyrivibrio sp. AE3004]|uniref:ABC transporter permease n=1 Tax=Butyrivibrio sp. AE3004 TaxID=1506994 RepID=UPI0006919EEE|nr:ABC transporter permease [Butyrivibrio sp. AE3004]
MKRAKRFPWISGLIILIFVLLGVAGPLITPYDPTSMSLSDKFIPPFFMEGGSFKHLLGTDELGRDVLSRIIIGGRISLIVALAAIVTGCVFGTALGIAAGYYGKYAETIIMRLTDASLAFPAILLALLLSLSIGPGIKSAIISIAFSMWAKYTRTVKTDIRILKLKNYVRQSKIMGATNLRVIFKHILPNISSLVISMLTMDVGMAIISEASLSFLGLSVIPPTPSWGLMIADGKDYFARAAWVSIFPAIATVITVISFQRIGEYIKNRR